MQVQKNLTLDDIFKLLANKIELKTGEDLVMKAEIQQCIKKQNSNEQRAYRQQILVQQCMDMRRKMNKTDYQYIMQIFAKSYQPEIESIQNDEQLLQMVKKPMLDTMIEKENLEDQLLQKCFKLNILPKLEEGLYEIAKDLRMTLRIAEGDTQEEITNKENELISATDEELGELYKSRVPVHQQIQLMQTNIDKMKILLGKSKEIKEELKYDVMLEDDKIDQYVELLGKEFIIDNLYANQKNSVEQMEQRLENLELQKKQQYEELKAGEVQQKKSSYEQVQHILDLRMKTVKVDHLTYEQQVLEYTSLKPQELIELKQIAKEYEKMMFIKYGYEKDIENNK